MHEKQLLDGKPRILSRKPNPNQSSHPYSQSDAYIEDTMEWKSDSMVLGLALVNGSSVSRSMFQL